MSFITVFHGKSTCAAFEYIAALFVVCDWSRKSSKLKTDFFDQSQNVLRFMQMLYMSTWHRCFPITIGN